MLDFSELVLDFADESPLDDELAAAAPVEPLLLLSLLADAEVAAEVLSDESDLAALPLDA